jgi:hypothetical protein
MREPTQFRMDGTPFEDYKYEIGSPEWLEEMRKVSTYIGSGDRRVGLTKVWWGAEVSTVHLVTTFPSFNRDEKLLFETMVFFRSSVDRYVERYATLEEAQEGHERIVKMARNPFKILFR